MALRIISKGMLADRLDKIETLKRDNGLTSEPSANLQELLLLE